MEAGFPTGGSQPTVSDLEAQLDAAKAAQQNALDEQNAPDATPVLDALKANPAQGGPHDFKERLSAVTTTLDEAGRIVTGDLITAAEEPRFLAVLTKLVGELAKVQGA